MSYYFADHVGYLTDAASIGGWRDFSSWALGQKNDVLHELVEKGWTEDLEGLQSALQVSCETPSVNSTRLNMLEAARRAKGILIISDGVGGNDPIGDTVERMAAAIPTWKKLHAVADQQAPAFSKHVLKAFDAGRKAVSPSTLESLMHLGHEALVVVMDKAVVAMKNELQKGMTELLLQSHNRGGEIAAKALMSSRNLRAAAQEEDEPEAGFSFGVTSEAARAWAGKHSGELIKGLTKTTVDDIGDAVDEVLQGNLTIESMAKQILDAVGSKERADLIASQETYNAVSNGQREAWDQAVENGVLDKTQQKEWIVTEGLACDECQAIADDGPIDLDEDYDTDDGPVDGPPLHVHCRCTEGLVS